MSRDQKTVTVSLEIVIGSRLTCETELEELSPKLISNKMAAGGELTGRSFFNNYTTDSLNYLRYIHIVCRCALLMANFFYVGTVDLFTRTRAVARENKKRARSPNTDSIYEQLIANTKSAVRMLRP